MFKRLLKHQLKSTWKEFNIAYAAIVVLALILSLAITSGNDVFITIAVILFSCSAIALTGLMVYFIIKLFYSTTYGKQGYLTFTLPISTHALIISKIVSALLYFIGYAISFVIACLLFVVIIDPLLLEQIAPAIQEIVGLVDANPVVIVILSIYGIITTLASLVVYQFVFALANTTTSSKKKVWTIIVLLWAVSAASSIVASFDVIGYSICLDYETNKLVLMHTFSTLEGLYELPILSIWEVLVELAKMIGLYFLTVHLIDKKLEIQ